MIANYWTVELAGSDAAKTVFNKLAAEVRANTYHPSAHDSDADAYTISFMPDMAYYDNGKRAFVDYPDSQWGRTDYVGKYGLFVRFNKVKDERRIILSVALGEYPQ